MLKKLLFIPGGPWISGKYWDSFLQKYYKDIPHERIVLTNHERDYNPSSTPSLSDLLEEIKSKIDNQLSEVNLIAHSYGALVVLLLLSEIPISRINKIILVCTPFSNKRNKIVSDYINTLEKMEITTNIDFAQYFESILKLYFNTESNTEKYKWITKESFMLGNDKLLFDDEAMKKCLQNLKDHEQKISFIFADNDLIIGNSWENNLQKRPHIIKDSGHFPMLEQPELFSITLNSLLK